MEDVDTSSFQHLTPDCKGHWIDVSTLKTTAFMCSECRVERSVRNPGMPPNSAGTEPSRSILPRWAVVALVVAVIVIVAIGIFGG